MIVNASNLTHALLHWRAESEMFDLAFNGSFGWFKTIAFAVVILAGLCINLYCIGSFLRNRNDLCQNHGTLLFALGINCADLVVLIMLLIPYLRTFDIELDTSSAAACKLVTFAGYLGTYVVQWCVVALSFQRCFMVLMPSKRHLVNNTRYMAIVIFAFFLLGFMLYVWLLAATGIVHISAQPEDDGTALNNDSIDDDVLICALLPEYERNYQFFAPFHMLFGLTVPLVLIVVLNLATIHKVYKVRLHQLRDGYPKVYKFRSLSTYASGAVSKEVDSPWNTLPPKSYSLVSFYEPRNTPTDDGGKYVRDMESRLTKQLVICTFASVVLNLPCYIAMVFDYFLSDLLLHVTVWSVFTLIGGFMFILQFCLNAVFYSVVRVNLTSLSKFYASADRNCVQRFL